jgi:hypothetical protein
MEASAVPDRRASGEPPRQASPGRSLRRSCDTRQRPAATGSSRPAVAGLERAGRLPARLQNQGKERRKALGNVRGAPKPRPCGIRHLQCVAFPPRQRPGNHTRGRGLSRIRHESRTGRIRRFRQTQICGCLADGRTDRRSEGTARGSDSSGATVRDHQPAQPIAGGSYKTARLGSLGKIWRLELIRLPSL